MTLVLRPAETDDLSALGALMSASFDPCYGEAWSDAQLLAALGFPDTWAELALGDGDPVGFSLTRRIGDEAELLLIAVRPEWRNRGVAGRLLASAAESARAKGATMLFLEVRATNDAALHLYQRNGFQVVGRRKDYYAGPGKQRYDALTMRRLLYSGQ